jgi:hypothetical protein
MKQIRKLFEMSYGFILLHKVEEMGCKERLLHLRLGRVRIRQGLRVSLSRTPHRPEHIEGPDRTIYRL